MLASIIITVGAMAATGGIATMINNIRPTREARKIYVERQFKNRLSAEAAIDVVSNGDDDGEAAADDGDTEGAANPQ